VKKILLVKLSSMGDIIQTLPAVTDAVRANPGLSFDWVVDDSFKDVPSWHPNVDKIISLPFRQWKKKLVKTLLSGDIKPILRELRAQSYDMVIDAQSNLKSAFVTRLSKGLRHGLDGASVREYGAQFAYHKKIRLPRNQNHALRMRQLMSRFLGYSLDEAQIDYGMKPLSSEGSMTLPENFIFVTAICSSSVRLWPEVYWHEVLADLTNQGYEIMLPWWSQEEKERVLRLQADNPRIHLLPPMDLSQKAYILSKAKASISLDTGLAHMAAALQVPNVSLYGPTSAHSTGTYGYHQKHVVATKPSCSPCFQNHCTYQGLAEHKPACMSSISPKQVLAALYSLLPNPSRDR